MRCFKPSLAVVKTLLASASLPVDDLPEVLEHFLACGDPAEPDGIVGLEVFGDEALLRSLVVTKTARNRGLGRILVAEAEKLALDNGVRRIYLLTDTAEEFFAKLGYAVADRQSAPESVRKSRQFSELCPASAAFMARELGR